MLKKKIFLLLSLLCLTITFAAVGGGLNTALSDLCNSAKNLLPTVAMLMIVLGAVIYAAGQLMGAETRARASVWATSCLTGAFMLALIVAVAPAFSAAIYPDANLCNCVGGRNQRCGGEYPPCCSGLACINGACACGIKNDNCGGGNALPCCNGLYCSGDANTPGYCTDANCLQLNAECTANSDCCTDEEGEPIVCRCVYEVGVCSADNTRYCTYKGASGDTCDENEDCGSGTCNIIEENLPLGTCE